MPDVLDRFRSRPAYRQAMGLPVEDAIPATPTADAVAPAPASAAAADPLDQFRRRPAYRRAMGLPEDTGAAPAAAPPARQPFNLPPRQPLSEEQLGEYAKQFGVMPFAPHQLAAEVSKAKMRVRPKGPTKVHTMAGTFMQPVPDRPAQGGEWLTAEEERRVQEAELVLNRPFPGETTAEYLRRQAADVLGPTGMDRPGTGAALAEKIGMPMAFPRSTDNVIREALNQRTPEQFDRDFNIETQRIKARTGKLTLDDLTAIDPDRLPAAEKFIRTLVSNPDRKYRDYVEPNIKDVKEKFEKETGQKWNANYEKLYTKAEETFHYAQMAVNQLNQPGYEHLVVTRVPHDRRSDVAKAVYALAREQAIGKKYSGMDRWSQRMGGAIGAPVTGALHLTAPKNDLEYAAYLRSMFEAGANRPGPPEWYTPEGALSSATEMIPAIMAIGTGAGAAGTVGATVATAAYFGAPSAAAVRQSALESGVSEGAAMGAGMLAGGLETAIFSHLPAGILGKLGGKEVVTKTYGDIARRYGLGVLKTGGLMGTAAAQKAFIEEAVKFAQDKDPDLARPVREGLTAALQGLPVAAILHSVQTGKEVREQRIVDQWKRLGIKPESGGQPNAQQVAEAAQPDGSGGPRVEAGQVPGAEPAGGRGVPEGGPGERPVSDQAAPQKAKETAEVDYELEYWRKKLARGGGTGTMPDWVRREMEKEGRLPSQKPAEQPQEQPSTLPPEPEQAQPAAPPSESESARIAELEAAYPDHLKDFLGVIQGLAKKQGVSGAQYIAMLETSLDGLGIRPKPTAPTQPAGEPAQAPAEPSAKPAEPAAAAADPAVEAWEQQRKGKGLVNRKAWDQLTPNQQARWREQFAAKQQGQQEATPPAPEPIGPSESAPTPATEAEAPASPPPAAPTAGQYVQWTSGGVDQFKNPRRVTGVSPDGSHVFVEGSSTGIPVGEAKPVDAYEQRTWELRSEQAKERAAWNKRVKREGGRQAKTEFGDFEKAVNGALKLLGLKASDPLTPENINEAYRVASRKSHPDRGGTASQQAAVNAAAELLRSTPATLELAKRKAAEQPKKKLGGKAEAAPPSEPPKAAEPTKAAAEAPPTAPPAQGPAAPVEAKSEPSAATPPEPTKSKGHVGFYTYEGTQYELYKDKYGDLYRAPVSNVIDAETGNRIGRWEAPVRQADKIAGQLLQGSEGAAAKEAPKKTLGTKKEPPPEEPGRDAGRDDGYADLQRAEDAADNAEARPAAEAKPAEPQAAAAAEAAGAPAALTPEQWDMVLEHRDKAQQIGERIGRKNPRIANEVSSYADQALEELVGKGFPGFDPAKGSFDAYLARALHNRIIDISRRQVPVREVPATEVPQAAEELHRRGQAVPPGEVAAETVSKLKAVATRARGAGDVQFADALDLIEAVESRGKAAVAAERGIKPKSLNRPLQVARELVRDRALADPEVAKALDQYVETKSAAAMIFPPIPIKFPDLAKVFRKFFTARGELPQEVYDAVVTRDSQAAVEMNQMRQLSIDLRRAVRKSTGGAELTADQAERLNAVLRNEAPPDTIPQVLRDPIAAMRRHIDILSVRLIAAGVTQGELQGIVARNLGTYVTRSYQIFDDAKWREHIPVSKLNNAIAYIRQEFPGKSDAEIHGIVEALLFRGAAETPVALLRGRKLGDKDLTVLMKRKDIPEPIRELWGEYKDAGVNYTRSVYKMSHLLANHEFLNTVLQKGMGKFLSREPIVNAYGKLSARIAETNDNSMSPLAGVYTTEEIRKAFDEAMQPQNMPGWLRALMAMNSIAKYSKTVLSPMTHVRNFTSGPWFEIANGRWRVGKAAEAWRASWSRIANGKDQVARDYWLDLVKYGLAGDNVRANELRAALRDAVDSSLAETGIMSPAERGLRKLGKAAAGTVEALYEVEDTFWKAYAWENEQARYRKAFPGWSEEQIKAHTAEIVRNTYPTYSKIGAGVRSLRRVPFIGPFVSYTAEVIRTTFNTLRIGFEEMKDPRTRGIGAQRFVGTIVALGTIPALSKMSMYLLGISPDDDKDVRKFVAPWQENSRFIYTKRDGAKIEMVDLGYSDPHSYLTDSVIAYMRGASFSESVAKAAGEFVRPFVSEEIFWKSVREAWSNKKDSGTTSGPVYNEEDTANEKAKAIIGHVLSAVEPGAISSGRRILKGFRGEVSEGGKAYDPKVEMAAVATGLRIQDIDIEQAASYRLREFARARERIEDILRKPLGRKGAVAPAEIVEARDRMEMLRKAEFAEVQETIQAARRLGVPLSKVVTIARAAGVKADELKLLVSGQYRPYQVSREMLKRSLQANPQEFPTRYKALLSPPAAPPDPGAATVPLGM